VTDPLATQAAIATFLQNHSTLSLATVNPDGQPLAASLFFVSDAALNVYWVSGAHSRHSRSLEHTPRAALTVHNATWSWKDIAGVQLEGQVAVVPPGAAWQDVWARYLLKFPFVGDFQAEVSRSNFYHFTPAWARLIDNGLGFGHKEEVSFPAGTTGTA
jgi:uncharacterized protein YhbP (UPF0306 family)